MTSIARAALLCAVLVPLFLTGCSAERGADTSSSAVPAAAEAHVHDAAGETCFICDPSKRDPGRLWCKEHGRYEDRCWPCHPELRDAERPYCEEHGLYEDECFLCDPARRSTQGEHGHDHGQDAPATATGGHAHPVGETCIICDPSKRDPGRLWCREHGRYEDRCWLCHPELRDAERPYCEEHGLYEDECFLCDPARGTAEPAGDASGDAADSHEGAELFCNEHQVPEHDCGICQPQLAGALPPGESLLVRLPSARSAELAGLSLGRPSRVEASPSATLLGEIRYDGNRLVRVTPLADGVIAAVHVDVGQVVQVNDVVATVNSPAVAEAKAAYITARDGESLAAADLGRKERLKQEEISSQRALDEARVAHRRAVVAASLARQGLLNLGFKEREITELGDDGGSTLLLRAPFSGTVVDRTAVQGAAVRSGEPLLEIADLSRMWVELSVPEETAASLAVGAEVEVRVRSAARAPVRGAVSWVGSAVDERTRLVRARAVVPNPERLLRQGMFADVTAVLASSPGAVRLPTSAVHQLSDLPFVFVQEEPDLFAARRVEVGNRLADDQLLVSAGIHPDDVVVVDGGFTLKSALLASRLGAGCVDD